VAKSSFQSSLVTLREYHGRPAKPVAATPLEMIIWENVAYLADDDRRLKAYRLLESTVGTTPEQILAASDESLMAVARHGIVPEQTVDKLRKIASIALYDFPDGLEAVLALPTKQAMKSLKKFPAIADPAAEKILLFTRTLSVLALESNGLRVLQRLGYGTQSGSYSSDYRAVQADVRPELPSEFDDLIDAYLLLRRHGQHVCRRSVPECGRCPLRDVCDYAATLA
jgi:endonuclease III